MLAATGMTHHFEASNAFYAVDDICNERYHDLLSTGVSSSSGVAYYGLRK